MLFRTRVVHRNLFRGSLLLRASTVPPSPPSASVSSDPSAASTGVDNKAVLHRLKTKDLSLQVPSTDGLVRFTFVQNKQLLAETLFRHGLAQSSKETVELTGSALSLVNLLAAQQEGEERVELRFHRNEVFENHRDAEEVDYLILCEALGLGECRARVVSDGHDKRSITSTLTEETNLTPSVLEVVLKLAQSMKVDRVLYKQKQKFTSLTSQDLATLVCEAEDAAEKGEPSGISLNLLPSFSKLQEMVLQHSTSSSPNPADTEKTLRLIKQYFNYFYNNLSLLGYNARYASDGVPSLVWCPTSLRPGVTGEAGSTWSSAEAVRDGLLQHSFGLLLTPLAAGAKLEADIKQIQVALTAATAAWYSDPHTSGERKSPLAQFMGDLEAHHNVCQSVLSLVSGDWEGSLAAAEKARTITEKDLTVIQKRIQPLREHLNIAHIQFSLQGDQSSRTGIDFFCRCSRHDILNSLIAAPGEVVESLEREQRAALEEAEGCRKVLSAQENKDSEATEAAQKTLEQLETQVLGVRCAYCGKRHVIKPEEFDKLNQAREEYQERKQQ